MSQHEAIIPAFSNLYIGGFRSLDSIGHSYGNLATEYGINVVHDWAVGIDRGAKTVTLAGGSTLNYDRLICHLELTSLMDLWKAGV